MNVLLMYYRCIMDLLSIINVQWESFEIESTSREKVKIPLPDWWIGKHGSEISMPKTNPPRTLSGKQVEEMIYNFLHNRSYVGNQVQRYFGWTKPVDIMQKWNNDIELYKDTSAVEKPLGIESGQAPSWRRYHQYVATEGVPIFHDDLHEKIPIRCSKKSTFDSCKGTQSISLDDLSWFSEFNFSLTGDGWWIDPCAR